MVHGTEGWGPGLNITFNSTDNICYIFFQFSTLFLQFDTPDVDTQKFGTYEISGCPKNPLFG